MFVHKSLGNEVWLWFRNGEYDHELVNFMFIRTVQNELPYW